MADNKQWTEIRSVTVEMVMAGQQRAYGDHIYEAFLTFWVPEGQMWASKYPGHDPELVKPYVKLFVHGFVDEGDEDGLAAIDLFYSPRLKVLEEVGPGKWHAIVAQPYID